MSRGRTAAVATTPGKRLGKRIASHWEFYLLLLPAIVITIIFKYIPIYGVQIAFRDYNPVQGFFGSPWAGWEWFERFFNNYNSVRMIRNTVLLSLYSLLWSFPVPVLLALMLNQVERPKIKATIQTVTYLPYFISTVVLPVWRLDGHDGCAEPHRSQHQPLAVPDCVCCFQHLADHRLLQHCLPGNAVRCGSFPV